MSQENKLIAAYVDDLKNRNGHTCRMMTRATALIIELDLPIDNDLLVNVYRRISEKKYKPKTRAYYVTCTRQFIKYLDANDKLPAGFSLTKAETKYKSIRGNERHHYHPKIFDPRIEKMRSYYHFSIRNIIISRGCGRGCWCFLFSHLKSSLTLRPRSQIPLVSTLCI